MSSNRQLTRTSSRILYGFTLVEMLVSISVLTLLIVAMTHLFNSAAFLTTNGNKHIDADAQLRPVFDRMAIDFGQLIQRSDVDYFVKGPNNLQTGGNDQIAFYSDVPGYYDAAKGPLSPISLVAYRINSNSADGLDYHQLQRLGKGLIWNQFQSEPASDVPMVFLPFKLDAVWPAATRSDLADPDYETLGPTIFRFEYCYLIKGQNYVSGSNPASLGAVLSATPWDTRNPLSHTALNGFRDVCAICVCVAVLDSKSLLLVSKNDLTALANSFTDFSEQTTPNPGDLELSWQTAVRANITLPPVVRANIRIYSRTFYFNKNL